MKSKLETLISNVDNSIEEFAIRNTFQKVIDGDPNYINLIGKANNPVTRTITRIRLGGPAIPGATISDKDLINALWYDVNQWSDEYIMNGGPTINLAVVATSILNTKYVPDDLRSDIVKSLIRNTESLIDNKKSLTEILINSIQNSNLYKITKCRLTTHSHNME